jgi:hypothetical protein
VTPEDRAPLVLVTVELRFVGPEVLIESSSTKDANGC